MPSNLTSHVRACLQILHDMRVQVSGEIVSDAITAIRTVTAFNLQPSVFALFDDSLIVPLKARMHTKNAPWLFYLGFGLSVFAFNIRAYAQFSRAVCCNSHR